MTNILAHPWQARSAENKGICSSQIGNNCICTNCERDSAKLYPLIRMLYVLSSFLYTRCAWRSKWKTPACGGISEKQEINLIKRIPPRFATVKPTRWKHLLWPCSQHAEWFLSSGCDTEPRNYFFFHITLSLWVHSSRSFGIKPSGSLGHYWGAVCLAQLIRLGP